MKLLNVLACLLLLPAVVFGQSRTHEEGEALDQKLKYSGIPYGFYSESFGLGLGLGGGVAHWPAPESSALGAVTVGTTGSFNAALVLNQIPVPGVERLYVQLAGVTARYQDQLLYVGRQNPGFEGQRAGTSGSDPDNVYEADQWDNWVKLKFRYLLPVADGNRGDIINIYTVNDGVLVDGATGGHAANPLKSGRTYLEIRPGWRRQTLETDEVETPLETFNVEFALERDNRDYPFNPSRGSMQRLVYQKDFTDQDGLGGWEFWSLQLQKVMNLGESEQTKQRVIAFDFAAGYVPTWETDDGGNVTSRPPPYEGAVLGGLYRMRGYESNRFSDKAGIYYGAEYRVIPRWQPLSRVDFLNWANIRYWQFAVFVEAGEVAESWDLDDLHSDIKFDGGISLRGMFYQAVCRLDVAVSDEGSRVVAMYGHPF